MNDPARHTLEPGCTYWVHTADGERIRVDLSDPDETWLCLPDESRAGFSTDHGWVRVLSPVIAAERDHPLSLHVEDATGRHREWTSSPVTNLVRSSKAHLPEAVWADLTI